MEENKVRKCVICGVVLTKDNSVVGDNVCEGCSDDAKYDDRE